MGRRGRELREAVASGKRLTVSAERSALMREVMRLAIPRLFQDRAVDEQPVSASDDFIVRAIADALPEALSRTGLRRFTVEELAQTPDWHEMRVRIIQGVAAHHERFRKFDGRGDRWGIRKRPYAGKIKGEWRFCEGCGVPRWAGTGALLNWKRCLPCHRAWLAEKRALAAAPPA